MIKTILIDDESKAIKAMEIALKDYCPDVLVYGTASSAMDGIRLIQKENPDLVFLDIEMPGMSGLELMEHFPERPFEVIFVTAYNQYAVNAFRVSAADYLLKPVNVLHLIQAVKKVSTRISEGKSTKDQINTEKLRNILAGKIGLPSLEGTEYVSISDIIRIEADGSYSKVFTTDKRLRLVSKNLGLFEESLEGESFFRVHKSHYINLSHMVRFSSQKDSGTVLMDDGSEIPVARSVKNDLAALIARNTK